VGKLQALTKAKSQAGQRDLSRYHENRRATQGIRGGQRVANAAERDMRES
jgi:hypothetical protein